MSPFFVEALELIKNHKAKSKVSEYLIRCILKTGYTGKITYEDQVDLFNELLVMVREGKV